MLACKNQTLTRPLQLDYWYHINLGPRLGKCWCNTHIIAFMELTFIYIILAEKQ